MYILDRFEDDLAVLISKEGDEKIITREVLGNYKEGDAFILSADGSFIYDAVLTETRKKSVRSRFARLIKKKIGRT